MKGAYQMKKVIIASLIAAAAFQAWAKSGLMPIRTEVFQELTIDQMGQEIPKGVNNLQSIAVEPVSESAVKYVIRFDSADGDSTPVSARVAYQDLIRMHVLDFYNCYSLGSIDGISIRRYPVSAVDKKMYRSGDGAFVLRIVFNCDNGVKTSIESEGNIVKVLFQATPKAAAAIAAGPKSEAKTKANPKVMTFQKRTLYGIGFTALAAVVGTYFYGHDRGENQGREDAYANPISRLPALPSQEQAFPPED